MEATNGGNQFPAVRRGPRADPTQPSLAADRGRARRRGDPARGPGRRRAHPGAPPLRAGRLRCWPTWRRLAVAAALGAGHALTPGHGKTLDGGLPRRHARGGRRHAVGLGLARGPSRTRPGPPCWPTVVVAAESHAPGRRRGPRGADRRRGLFDRCRRRGGCCSGSCVGDWSRDVELFVGPTQIIARARARPRPRVGSRAHTNHAARSPRATATRARRPPLTRTPPPKGRRKGGTRAGDLAQPVPLGPGGWPDPLRERAPPPARDGRRRPAGPGASCSSRRSASGWPGS